MKIIGNYQDTFNKRVILHVGTTDHTKLRTSAEDLVLLVCCMRAAFKPQTAGIRSVSLAMHSEMKIKPCNESKKKLHEKVAIVTGSTYGIGFAIARRLAQDGAHVLICSRKKENVEKAAEQLKDEGLSFYAMQCHVGNKEDRERLVAKALEVYGKIDILVCNAAVNPFVGPIFDTTEEMWTKVNIKIIYVSQEEIYNVLIVCTFKLLKLHLENRDCMYLFLWIKSSIL
ncbi:unnamed protein product [Ranitomeya imitator]|uniref:Dehydrogenase/reductase SDR family member 4 n=1 Tax=Ranitomeya imitator TaxID=111125 RepID=A0ABN9LG73_9NEOB|nr:unnamed protein product [Ranitomeya imitator]